TLVQKLNAGAYRSGGFLSEVALDSDLPIRDPIVRLGVETYFQHQPIRGDFALIRGGNCDRWGNLSFPGGSRNFNTTMAAAADVTIAEVDTYTEEPIPPEQVHLSGLYVDIVTVTGEED